MLKKEIGPDFGVIIGRRDPETGRLTLKDHYAAKLLSRALTEQWQEVESKSAEMIKVMDAINAGQPAERDADRISGEITAGYQRYAQLLIAYTQARQRLDPTDEYAGGHDAGLLPDMDKYVPGFNSNIKNLNKLSGLIWGAIGKEEDASVKRMQDAQEALDKASWVLLADGILTNAAKIGEAAVKATIEAGEKATKKLAEEAADKAARRYIAVEVLKVGGWTLATMAAMNRAEAAGVNKNVLDVGSRVAFAWIQVRAAIRARP